MFCNSFWYFNLTFYSNNFAKIICNEKQIGSTNHFNTSKLVISGFALYQCPLILRCYIFVFVLAEVLESLCKTLGNGCWQGFFFTMCICWAFKYSFNSSIEAGIIKTSVHSVEELGYNTEAEQKHMCISFIQEPYQTKDLNLMINEWILNIRSKVYSDQCLCICLHGG